MSRGLFITFEGPEGGGKTTQIHRLVDSLRSQGRDVLPLREPGGTTIGEKIRALLLDLAESPMQIETEALLFLAARRELVQDRILPALQAGRIVICDRFADATLAYQGYGRGMDLAALKALNAFATVGLQPDLTLLLDLPVESGLQRRKMDPADWNRFDAASLAFHQQVRQGYLALAGAEPGRWRVIDAARAADVVAVDVWRAVGEVLAVI
ncbi:MAG: dTMP kinase [Anaerolineae bacterium]|jgi:dTMP kinase|nr:dTMP kinase [Ardenticatenia bacterium]MBK8540345.1 dTMP kinase [Ardenticatenia bacterium]HQZ70040.1 dTMP kinase [Anaerolineae bacterium]HRA18970.1 dTMP kinase [Anaerolineae bacterium]